MIRGKRKEVRGKGKRKFVNLSPSSFLLPLLLAYCLLPIAYCLKISTSPHFTVQTTSATDEQRLPEVFRVLEQAYRDLLKRGYKPPAKVTVVVHANLESFRAATKLPWFVLAAANQKQNRIDLQRLRIVAEKGLETTLRHELFHLAQPGNWPRWKAEGMAMRFAGQRPNVAPLHNINPAQLDRILANPPDQKTLARAMATAYASVNSVP